MYRCDSQQTVLTGCDENFDEKSLVHLSNKTLSERIGGTEAIVDANRDHDRYEWPFIEDQPRGRTIQSEFRWIRITELLLPTTPSPNHPPPRDAYWELALISSSSVVPVERLSTCWRADIYIYIYSYSLPGKEKNWRISRAPGNTRRLEEKLRG